MTYQSPTQDIQFALETLANLEKLATLPGLEDATTDVVAQMIEEGGKFFNDELAPTNWDADQAGCSLENGVVRTYEKFPALYAQYRETGWIGAAYDPEIGGLGLPWAVNAAGQEMLFAANMSFSLCPLLSQGAIEAIEAHGSPEQRAKYLERLVSGEWSGTMNLTEPHAGSDVGSLKSRAEPQPDGTYRIFGQKIYITFGEHDMADNIIHLVLARTPGAPAGTKGISLFIVPKFLVNDDGSLGARNDAKCIKLEEKLGIHASPTCVMQYGDDDGAVGYLIGPENGGMACMFTMMNNARLSVGIQGLGIAERAYQHALAYAKDRVQSAKIGGSSKDSVRIIEHPDVRRNLLLMKSQIEAFRGMAYHATSHIDIARRADDRDEAAKAQRRVDLLTPIVKGWGTDIACEIASTGVQIHGGMGFVEETGAAQHYRDARILPIYEGTNGIQALDLIGRKLARDRGWAVGEMMDEMQAVVDALNATDHVTLSAIAARLSPALADLQTASDYLLQTAGENMPSAAVGATPYLTLWGTVAGGWVMATEALEAARRLISDTENRAFLETKLVSARFFADQLLPRSSGLLEAVRSSTDEVIGLDEAAF
ncbi:MAG: acyl-CoA dehydrogenase [Alphaproteobacteria bacterium TMED89]|nr:acyl-CoA dehydrogenase [Rhodospirillaceae bacterium]RPH19948.1 MAG: acyl-CoA dehydrogenase [Alphaproteobacteria bacterium TMED89]